MATSPVTLSTPEFHAAVRALQPRVAVFDCDGTLWSGDAGSGFMRWSIETRLIAPRQIAWLSNRYCLYEQGAVSELEICGDMVQVYAGLPESTLRTAAAEFFRNHIEPHIFPELQKLITDLQRNGVDIWAVSSTNDWVIEEGARRFAIPPSRLLAARVHIDAGIVTDRLIDVPTDQGKVAALARVGLPHPDCVFGNSIHDAAMLAIARRAFPVNPSPALIDESTQRNWPIFYPSGVTSAGDPTHA